MKRIGTYFCLQFKRALKSLPIVLGVSAVLFLALGIIISGILTKDAQSEDKQKFRVGIVGDTSESYLGLGIAAIETLDSSRFTIDFLELNEDEAKLMLEAGDLSAYVVIPDGFIDDAVHGDVGKITYVTGPGSVGLTTIFKNEIADFISQVLIHSQKGVYATGGAMRDEGIDGRSEAMDKIAIEYFSFILNRSKLYSTEILGISDSLSFGGYMMCGILIFFLFMWGISCCFLFVRRNISLSVILKAKDSGALIQIIGEYLAYLALMIITLLGIILALIPFSSQLSGFIPELEGAKTTWILSFSLKLIPCAMLISAVQFLIYETISGIVAGVLAQFISTIALSYVGGCLYPISFFPETVIKLSEFLPSGIARSYLSSALLGQSAIRQLFVIAIYFIFILGLTVGARTMRIRRGR